MSPVAPTFVMSAIATPEVDGPTVDLFRSTAAYLERCDPALVDLVSRRLRDEAVLRRLVDRFTDLIDLMEDGRADAAVSDDARAFHREIMKHLRVARRRYVVRANVGGDGDTKSEHPRLKRGETDVRLGDRGAVLFFKGRMTHGALLDMARLTALWRAIVKRVRAGGQS